MEGYLKLFICWGKDDLVVFDELLNVLLMELECMKKLV